MPALVVLLCGMLVAGSAIPADRAPGCCVVSWELADDTVASVVLDAAVTPPSVAQIDPPLVVAVATAATATDAPRAIALTTAPGRAPPAC